MSSSAPTPAPTSASSHASPPAGPSGPADPHREARERAERLLAWVDRELLANPSSSAPAALAVGRPSLPFIPGLRA